MLGISFLAEKDVIFTNYSEACLGLAVLLNGNECRSFGSGVGHQWPRYEFAAAMRGFDMAVKCSLLGVKHVNHVEYECPLCVQTKHETW